MQNRTLHSRLKSVDGIDLGDDDTGAKSPESLNATFTDISVAGDHRHLPRDHHIRGSLDAVNQRLAAAVQVVKFAL